MKERMKQIENKNKKKRKRKTQECICEEWEMNDNDERWIQSLLHDNYDNSMVFSQMYMLLFPTYATRISQHETTRPSVGDEKLHIDTLWLGKKKYVHCILYEQNVNFERML